MSGVNFMKELLDGVAVEWRPLGSLAEIYGGLTGKNKADFDGGNAKYVSYKNIFANINVDLSSLESVKVAPSENQHQVKYGDVLFTGSSEIADEAGMSSAVTTHFEESVFLNSFSFGVRFNKGIPISPEFSKYLFRTSFMRTEIAKTASGVTRFNVSKERFRKILVPVLCPDNPKKSLEIQAEIVRILDAFTELITELTTELTTRKKQYKHYRDQLLSFEDGEVEWMPLGDVAKILNGYAFKSSSYTDSGIRVIRISDVQKGQMSDANPKYYPTELADEIRKYLLDEGDLVMSLTGNAGRVAMLSKTDLPAGLNQRVACLRPISDVISTRYLFHYLNQDCFESEAMANATGGGQKNMSTTWLASYLIPVPSLQDQRRIVAILDKFDALTNSITEGLPREIELRQKQYEHYRDLLLSFPKPQEVEA